MARRTFQKKTENTDNKVKLCLLIFMLFVAYLLIGSVIFAAIEKNNEKKETEYLSKEIERFLEQNECLDENELQDMFTLIKESIRNGAYSVTFNATFIKPDLIWDTISGVFFCFTIVTTIGFGHITPKTVGGQVFCIIYAAIGIPITGYLLSLLGDNIEQFWTWYQRLFKKKFRFIRSVRLRSVTSIAFGTVTVLVLTLFLPSYYWSLEEGWTYWTSIYYTFITMTTIGFGDYVASIGDSNIPLFTRILDLIITVFTILLALGIVTGILKIASKRIEKSKSFGTSRLSTMVKKLIGNETMSNELDNKPIQTISNDLAKCKTNGNHNQLHVCRREGPSASAADGKIDRFVQNTHVEDEVEKRRVSDSSQVTDLSCADVSLESLNRLELYVNKQLIISKDGLSDEMIADIRDVINNHILEATETTSWKERSTSTNKKKIANGKVNDGFIHDRTHSRKCDEDKCVHVDLHSMLASDTV